MNSILEVVALQALNSGGKTLSPPVSFQLKESQVLFFRGENGAGKSTLLKTLLGLHPYFQGHYNFLIQMSEVQYLPQLGNLHFHLPLSLRDMVDAKTSESTLLAGLDLSKKWNTASGGERQKVLLASVLQKKPRLLVLDEPFNHVDHDSGFTLENSLQEFLRDHPKSSLLLVSHRPLQNSWLNVQTVEIR